MMQKLILHKQGLIRLYLGLFSAISVATTGCGGGGGGGGDDKSIPAICRVYCAFACSRASQCGIFPESQLQTCDNSCVQTIERNGATNESCDRAGDRISNASCSEVASILGLRTLEKELRPDSETNEQLQSFAEHSGAEFGLRAEDQS